MLRYVNKLFNSSSNASFKNQPHIKLFNNFGGPTRQQSLYNHLYRVDKTIQYSK